MSESLAKLIWSQVQMDPDTGRRERDDSMRSIRNARLLALFLRDPSRTWRSGELQAWVEEMGIAGQSARFHECLKDLVEAGLVVRRQVTRKNVLYKLADDLADYPDVEATQEALAAQDGTYRATLQAFFRKFRAATELKGRMDRARNAAARRYGPSRAAKEEAGKVVQQSHVGQRLRAEFKQLPRNLFEDAAFALMWRASITGLKQAYDGALDRSPYAESLDVERDLLMGTEMPEIIQALRHLEKWHPRAVDRAWRRMLDHLQDDVPGTREAWSTVADWVED